MENENQNELFLYSKNWKKAGILGSSSGKYDVIVYDGKLSIMKHSVNMALILGLLGLLILNLVGVVLGGLIGYSIDRSKVKKNRSKFLDNDGTPNKTYLTKAISTVDLNDLEEKISFNKEKGLMEVVLENDTYKNKKEVESLIGYLK